MTRTIRDRTANARNLIAGLAGEDIRVTRTNDAWAIVPVSGQDAEGCADEGGLVAELIGLGLLDVCRDSAIPSRRGLRFAGLEQGAEIQLAGARKRPEKQGASGTA
ncbi:MAG: hypothetical protein KDE63_08435, partial [Novosphingobium sp.]|nr:hypothetical protein [Novosphingobium sp.]